MTSRQAIAIDHLRMLQLERNTAQDRIYVRLAFSYGVEVPAIAEASGLAVEAVRSILRGE